MVWISIDVELYYNIILHRVIIIRTISIRIVGMAIIIDRFFNRKSMMTKDMVWRKKDMIWRTRRIWYEGRRICLCCLRRGVEEVQFVLDECCIWYGNRNYYVWMIVNGRVTRGICFYLFGVVFDSLYECNLMILCSQKKDWI